MVFILQFFADSLVQDVPDLLFRRPNGQTTLLLGIGFIGLMLIGLSRMWNINSVSTVVRVFLNSETIEQAQKENMRFTSMSFVLLLANYTISSALMFWLLVREYFPYLLEKMWVLVIFFPLLIAVYELLGILSVGFITGEQKKTSVTLPVTLVSYTVIGMLLLLIAFIWILNPAWKTNISMMLIIITAFFYLVRLLRNGVLVLRNGVPWYYLILYFCTLEILPVVVGFNYFTENF